MINRFFARRRLARARTDFVAAQAEWDQAYEIGDTRRLHAAAVRLRAANQAVLTAEVAIYPMPPLPRAVPHGR